MEDHIIEDLTLLLLHLTSWEEQVHKDLTIHWAWKGFRYEALDALQEAGYLTPSRGAKSVTLSEAGIEHARALGPVSQTTLLVRHQDVPAEIRLA